MKAADFRRYTRQIFAEHGWLLKSTFQAIPADVPIVPTVAAHCKYNRAGLYAWYERGNPLLHEVGAMWVDNLHRAHPRSDVYTLTDRYDWSIHNLRPEFALALLPSVLNLALLQWQDASSHLDHQ